MPLSFQSYLEPWAHRSTLLSAFCVLWWLRMKAKSSCCPWGLPTSTLPRFHLKSSISLPVRLTLASLLFLTHLKDIMCPRTFALAIFYPWNSSPPDIHTVHSLMSFKSWLTCPFLSEPSLIHLFFQCNNYSPFTSTTLQPFFLFFSFMAVTTSSMHFIYFGNFFESWLSSHLNITFTK